MPTDYLSINGGEYVPAANIRKISPITEEERNSLASLDNVEDAAQFNTRIDFSDKSKSYVPETIDEIDRQGANLVSLDERDGPFVLAQNIKKARDLTERDGAAFEAKTGRKMDVGYMSRIETKAGTVLASVRADIVMKRMSQPQRAPASPSTEQAAATEPTEDSEREAFQSAAEAYGLG